MDVIRKERETLTHDVLVMRCVEGFYLIDVLSDVPIEKQARDHGELNPHILRVELFSGEVLWSREEMLATEIIQ